MELANGMQEYLRSGGAREAEWESSVRVLVKLLTPLAPHVGEEMWERLGERGLLADASWPSYDPADAVEPKVVVVVQVAGKLRDRLGGEPGVSEADGTRWARAREKDGSALYGPGAAEVSYVP